MPTVQDLKKKCKELGIKGYSKWKKAELLKNCGSKNNIKVSPKRASSKCASPKRASPKRASPKRASPKRASPKRASPKRASPKRASPKRASPKRASPKRASPKRASPKRASPKRASPKRASPKRRAPKRASPQGSKQPIVRLKPFLEWARKNITVLWCEYMDKNVKKPFTCRASIGLAQFAARPYEKPENLLERIVDWVQEHDISGKRNEYIFHFYNRICQTKIGPVMCEVDEKSMNPKEVLESYRQEMIPNYQK